MKTLRQAWGRLAAALPLRRSHASPWEGHAVVRDQTWRLTDRLVAALAALMASALCPSLSKRCFIAGQAGCIQPR